MTDEMPILDERMYDQGPVDMVTRMKMLPGYRESAQYFDDVNQWSRFGEQLHNERELEAPNFPNHVVTRPIVVQEGGEELRWKYQTKQLPYCVHLRRVFALRNQALELDVENTLIYLSASESPEVKSQLETEATDLVNEMILQVMKDRLDGGDSMLPNSPYEPLK